MEKGWGRELGTGELGDPRQGRPCHPSVCVCGGAHPPRHCRRRVGGWRGFLQRALSCRGSAGLRLTTFFGGGVSVNSGGGPQKGWGRPRGVGVGVEERAVGWGVGRPAEGGSRGWLALGLGASWRRPRGLLLLAGPPGPALDPPLRRGWAPSPPRAPSPPLFPLRPWAGAVGSRPAARVCPSPRDPPVTFRTRARRTRL